MKRILALVFVALLAAVLAGCGSSGTVPGTGETSTTSTPTTATATSGPKVWTAMPLGPQEDARLQSLDGPIALYVANEKKAGRTPVALANKTPRFVGYQVQIWAKRSNGKYEFGFIDVTNGRIDAMGDLQIPLTAAMVGLQKDQSAVFRSNVVPKSAGEKDAVAKAVKWAAGAFPGLDWNAEIAGYDFYFDLGGGKYVLFTASAKADGYRVLKGPLTPPKTP
jgi:predicted small secreted protein